ncbi:MAG: biotin--[acetyl-CoA-carboxylase] ligase [Flavobacteriales bacterium]|nr:biotin--[acetyl-CoA-carboxylase] ligase [Flavobacteriales bacterium]
MIGAVRFELPIVDSTNKHAAELVRLTEVQHGTVILAHVQTEGRGQRGHVWQSEPGQDLTFSVVLRPEHFAAGDQFLIAQSAALAVWDVVAGNLVAEVRVKWPNDVLAGIHKVAGILITNEVMGGQLRSSIVGIGLNVNSSGHVPGAMATSLRVELGRHLDRMVIYEELLNHFEYRWQQALLAPDTLRADYLERLWGRGRWLPMELDGAAIQARPMEVDREGRLVVELTGGRVQAFGLDRLRFGPR